MHFKQQFERQLNGGLQHGKHGGAGMGGRSSSDHGMSHGSTRGSGGSFGASHSRSSHDRRDHEREAAKVSHDIGSLATQGLGLGSTMEQGFQAAMNPDVALGKTGVNLADTGIAHERYGDYNTFKGDKEIADEHAALREQKLANEAWDAGHYGDWMEHKMSSFGNTLSAWGRGEVREWGGAPMDKLADTMRGPLGGVLAIGTLGASLPIQAGIGLADTAMDVAQGEVDLKGAAIKGLEDLGMVNPVAGLVGHLIDDPFSTTAGAISSKISTGNPIGDLAMQSIVSLTAQKAKDAIEGTDAFNAGSAPVQQSFAQVNRDSADREHKLYQQGYRETPPVVPDVYQSLQQKSPDEQALALKPTTKLDLGLQDPGEVNILSHLTSPFQLT